MSKEREAFEEYLKNKHHYTDAWLEKDIYGSYLREDLAQKFFGWQAASILKDSHYQPLLDAKDAEIAELKALLEQAREAFENIEYIAENNAAGIIDDEDFIENDESPEDAISYNSTLIFRVCKKILAAINAALGEK